MRKSVLIINTPTSCGECLARREAEREPIDRYVYRQLHKCMVKDKYLSADHILEARPPWCPLKDIQE